ncbi:MAG: PilZ domain-containing protein [Planctomycetes bacterium]|nr:PilZ domain-containing protein [Planctomycetota bacterium]
MAKKRNQTAGNVIPSSKARRRYPRFSKDAVIHYKILELDEMPHRGETINISGGGARFKSESEIPSGSVVAVEITLPKADAPVLAMGKVVWSKQNADGVYENGIEFWWLGYRGDGNTSTTPFGTTST